MTSTGRNATVAVVAAAVMMVAGQASAQEEPTALTAEREAEIVLHVYNYAALSRDILDVALARVAMVYERIDARVVWVDDEGSVKHRQDGRLHLTVLLLSREMAEKTVSSRGIKDGVLAQAHPPSGRAYIFCERIATMPGGPTYFANPLGDIIAHEIGHLVLGGNSHTRSGIMRPHVDMRALPLQSFEKMQARTIRATLMDLTADATAR